jgi:hypothetical protein
LGISYWTVYYAVRGGRIPTTRLSHLVLLRLDDVRAALGLPQDPAPTPKDAAAVQAAAPCSASDPLAQAEVGQHLPTNAASARNHFKRCPECGEAALGYQEGCKLCFACGYSAC